MAAQAYRRIASIPPALSAKREQPHGGPPKQLTNFTADSIPSFAVSRDGKHLAISRGSASLDVVLIKDFR